MRGVRHDDDGPRELGAHLVVLVLLGEVAVHEDVLGRQALGAVDRGKDHDLGERLEVGVLVAQLIEEHGDVVIPARDDDVV